MEEMELEKSLAIEYLRLWSLKALKVFLVIKKKPATGHVTQSYFFGSFWFAAMKAAVSFYELISRNVSFNF